MERAEYELMNAVEDRMWWYRGAHANALALYGIRHRRGKPSAGLALDAGCGTGGLLAKLAAATDLPPVCGLDYAERAAELARAKSNRPVVVGTVNALPFQDESLAVIFSMDVLCHKAADQSSALHEAHRCLVKGGALVINLPAYQWMHSVHDERVHNARRFTRREVVALLHAAGFPDVHASYWNMILFPLMLLRRKLLPVSDKSDVQLYPAPIETIFRAILTLERAMMRLGIRLPFGGSIMAVAIKF
jgi:SAM-dependent methyltransferase